MSTYLLSSQIHLDAPLDRVFAFFSEAENLEILTPPFLRFEIESPTPVEMKRGTTIDYRLRVRGVPLRWRSEIPVWDPPYRFMDRQVHGPYRLWEHDHRFQETAEGTRCVDLVRFEVPFGLLAFPLFVRRDLERIFEYRRKVLFDIFEPARSTVDGSPLEIRPLPAAA